jgi:uncharacterized membrane protein YphA (DoxX/SURF4 family)
MKKLLTNKTLIFLMQVFLGGVFLYACFDKIANPAAFAKAVNNYRIIPESLINLMAIYLPWLELFAGTFLIFGKFVKGSVTIINAMLIVFIIAISIALARGLDISCGCFSTAGGHRIGFLKLLEDLIYLAIGVIIYWNAMRKSKATVTAS